MRISRLMHAACRALPLAAAALALSAPLASAQPGRGRGRGHGPWEQGGPKEQNGARGRGRSSTQTQTLFEWTGAVDREKQIIMRGNQVWTRDVGRTEPRAGNARRFASIPRQPGHIVLRVLDGRGDVRVIQQPSERNHYTAIVRITDPRGGADRYRLAAYWQGYEYANGGIEHRDRRGDVPGDYRWPWFPW